MRGPIPGFIPGCEMWASHLAFLCCSVGSPGLHWGNNEASIGKHVKALTQCLQRDKSLMKVKVLVTQLCPTLCHPRLLHLWDSPGKNTGMGFHALLQGIFLMQELNPLHCRQILYCLSHQGMAYVITEKH